MPSNMLFMDTLFPKISEEDSDKEAIKKILNYQFMLNEQLKYSFFNLGAENFNEVEWDNLTEPIYASIGNAESAISELALTEEGLGARVSNVEQGVAELTLTAQGLSVSVEGLTGEVGTLSSQVSLSADTIASIVANVGKDGTVSAASIVQAVNAAGSTVMISADKIMMTGSTTFLTAADVGKNGSTTINGSLITTGQLDANLIAGGTIMGVDLISSQYINSSRTAYGQMVDISNGAIDFYYRSSAGATLRNYGSIYADASDSKFYIYGAQALKLESDNGISITANNDILYLYGETLRFYPSTSTQKNYWEITNTGIFWKSSGGSILATVLTQAS